MRCEKSVEKGMGGRGTSEYQERRASRLFGANGVFLVTLMVEFPHNLFSHESYTDIMDVHLSRSKLWVLKFPPTI